VRGRGRVGGKGRSWLALLLLLGGGCDGVPDRRPEGESAPALTREEVEERARRALGDLDGTVLVMDPRTGQLLAVVNPRLATRQAFPPGSTIKPFLALAALESGRINGTETRMCQGGERRQTRNLLCSHRPFAGPLTLTQALAHSCNDYFLALGERLGEGATLGYLRAWGFGEPTGWGAGESAGRFPQMGWSREGALGTEEELLVTPLQLLRAYQGIVNEGRLCRPSEHTLACETVRRVPLTERHRLDILQGLRAAVKEGTASAALPDLSRPVKDRIVLYGKTGTSGASNQFRTQGWFVGLLSWRSASPDSESVVRGPGAGTAAPHFRLAVLVFLKRASGADAAAVARPLLADLAEGLLASPAALSATEPGGMRDGAETIVRLGPTRGGEPVRLPLEQYLAGVLLGEAGHETELEALKAQAVVSRTFALANLGRHAANGYDFCRTTHCQAYKGAPGAPPLIRRALLATRGELLRSRDRGGLAEVYFHASCGGRTTHPQAVWGGPDSSPAHLQGVEDPICEAAAPRRWEDRLSLAALDQALRGDLRTDPGGTLRRLRIERRDRTGRVAWIELDSSRGTRRVRGWDLRLAVGRALGWQRLKSTWFDLQPEGAGYRFRGRGFGHGLGLCQEGTHLRAQQGMGYRQILAHYFPGTVRQVAAWEKPGEWGWPDPPQWLVANSPRLPAEAGSSRRRFRSEGIEWDVPAQVDARQLERARQRLDAALADLRRRLAEAALAWPLQKTIHLYLHETTSEFIRETGHSGWATGVATRDRIDLQPLSLLERRGELTPTLRHELAHVAIERLATTPPPRWLAEGLALHFAGQGPRLLSSLPRRSIPPLSLDQLEAGLASPAATPAAMRPLLAAAYQRVASYRKLHGESALWRLLAAPSPSPSSPLVSIDTPWDEVYKRVTRCPSPVLPSFPCVGSSFSPGHPPSRLMRNVQRRERNRQGRIEV